MCCRADLWAGTPAPWQMTDEEKIKSPGVIIGLAILILPFVAGIIALQFYR